MLWRQIAVVASLLVVQLLWWPRATRDTKMQAAVLGDGFALIRGERISELDEDGRVRAEIRVRGLPADTRVIGVTTGIAVVYRDGRRMVFAEVDRDGRLSPYHYGKRVERVCEGTATNDTRFGVAWLEADGAVWFVGGPTSASVGLYETPAPKTYCAIASAGKKIALVWREGKRVELALCDKKCGIARKAAIDARPILGVACTAGACAFAQRGERGVDVTWVTHGGKRVWQKPLPDATPDSKVEMVGAGDRIAIAYDTGGEPAIRAADKSGGLAAIWQDRADALPALAWSNGKLLIARLVDGTLVTERR